MLKKVLIALILVPTIAVAGPYVGTGDTKISSVSSYTNYGDGDVVFKIASPIDACSHGYWFTKTDAGYNANLSMVIAAHQAKTNVIIYGLPDQMWAGSSGKYCKLYNVELK